MVLPRSCSLRDEQWQCPSTSQMPCPSRSIFSEITVPSASLLAAWSLNHSSLQKPESISLEGWWGRLSLGVPPSPVAPQPLGRWAAETSASPASATWSCSSPPFCPSSGQEKPAPALYPYAMQPPGADPSLLPISPTYSPIFPNSLGCVYPWITPAEQGSAATSTSATSGGSQPVSGGHTPPHKTPAGTLTPGPLTPSEGTARTNTTRKDIRGSDGNYLVLYNPGAAAN